MEHPISDADISDAAMRTGFSPSLLRVGVAVFFLFIVSISGLCAIFFNYLARRLGQKSYDISSSQLYSEIVAGEHREFSIYLRPFYITNKVYEQGVVVPLLSPTAYLRDPSYRLEIQLVKALRPVGPVIALGRPGEAIGVGRVLTSEQTWKPVVAKLMGEARYIICVPSGRPGTLWELGEIFNRGFQPKAIFVMPPASRVGLFRKPVGIEADWAELVTAMRPSGVYFPSYNPKGSLFIFDSSSRIKSADFALSSPRKLRKHILKLTGDRGPSWWTSFRIGRKLNHVDWPGRSPDQVRGRS